MGYKLFEIIKEEVLYFVSERGLNLNEEQVTRVTMELENEMHYVFDNTIDELLDNAIKENKINEEKD